MFFHDGRVQRISLAILLAIAIASVLTIYTDESRESLITRGDFPGLLVQGVILSRGEAARLYDFEYQREIENQIWPSFKGGLYVSVYPPYHAVLMRPFAELQPLHAQILFTVLMIFALFGSLAIVKRLNLSGTPPLIYLFALTLAFPPLFFGVFGAQNTALSMLLYAIVLFQTKKNSKAGDLLSGLALGAWLFKPQFSLIGGVFALIMWRPFMLFGFGIVASLYYLIAAYLMGPLWIITWAKATGVFAIQNYLVNGPQMTSLIATVKMVLILIGIPPQSDVFDTVSLIAHSIILLLLAMILMRILKKRLTGELNPYHAMLTLGPVIALFSPNTLFYDLGIPLVSLLCIADFKSDKTYWSGLAIWIGFGILIALRPVLTIPLFCLFPLLVLKKLNNGTPTSRSAS